MEVLCPITKMPIAHFAITRVGSIYEEADITRWLRDNDTDPATGLPLTDKSLISGPGVTTANVEVIASALRASVTAAFKNPLDGESKRALERTGREHAQLAGLPREVQQPVIQWGQALSRAVHRACRISPEAAAAALAERLDSRLPEIPGTGLEHCVFCRGKLWRGMDLHGRSFNGADLEGTTFLDCNMRDCTFVYARMGSVTFERCDLTGRGTDYRDVFKSPNLFWLHCRATSMSSTDADNTVEFSCCAMRPAEVLLEHNFEAWYKPTQRNSFLHALMNR